MSNVIIMSKKTGKVNVTFGDNSILEEPLQSEPENQLQVQLEAYYSDGFEAGQKAVKDQLQQEFTDKLLVKYAEFHSIVSTLEENFVKYEAAFEKVVVDLSFAITEKIIRRELERESIIKDVLKDSIKKIIGANEVVVKLHPDDYNSIIVESNNFLTENTFTKIKFEPESQIERGGCLVETEIGNVDARISTQLEEIKKNLAASSESVS